MTNVLIGCDPKEVSPARAGAVFSEFAKKLSTEQGIDFTQAWNKAKLLHPDLHARMCETTQAAAPTPDDSALANSFAFAKAPLASKAFIAPAFHLPLGVADDVFAAAWQANGKQSITVDSGKIFLALCAKMMKDRKLSASDARRQMQEDYPNLSRAAGQMPGVS